MEERQKNAENEPGPAWREAEAYGFDMSLIESNLRRTPLERIRIHTRSLRAAQQLREAVLRKRHV